MKISRNDSSTQIELAFQFLAENVDRYTVD